MLNVKFTFDFTSLFQFELIQIMKVMSKLK